MKIHQLDLLQYDRKDSSERPPKSMILGLQGLRQVLQQVLWALHQIKRYL
jgi:hypothetical protein